MATIINSISSDGTTTFSGTCPRVNVGSALLDNTTTAITTSYLTTLASQPIIPLNITGVFNTVSNFTFTSAGRIASNFIYASGTDNLTFASNNLSFGANITACPVSVMGSRIFPNNLSSRWCSGNKQCKVVSGVFSVASGTAIAVPTTAQYTVNDATTPVIMLTTPTTNITAGCAGSNTLTGGATVFTGAGTPAMNVMFIGF